MPTIRFRIRKHNPDKRGNCQIVIVYQKGRDEAAFSTGKKTNPDLFNIADIKEPIKGDTETNIHLRSVYSKLNRIVDAFYLANNDYPTANQVKYQWNTINVPNRSVFDYFDDYINFQQTKGAESVSYGTILNYRNVKTKLKEYEDKTHHPITFESFTETFAGKFNHYLIHDCGMLPNSAGEKLKTIKAWLKWCRKQGQYVNENALDSYKGTNDKTWKLYLSIEDLKTFQRTETNFAETKDAFLLQCCLGVRYSDLKTIVSSKIVKDGSDFYYVTTTKKTNKLIRVKLIDIAKEILNRRTNADWIPSNVQMNLELKLIFKLIPDFNVPISITQGSGNAKREITKPKYDFVSTHTARVSYINIMRKLNVDDFTISSITGQSLATLRGYYHTSANDTDKAMELLNMAM